MSLSVSRKNVGGTPTGGNRQEILADGGGLFSSVGLENKTRLSSCKARAFRRPPSSALERWLCRALLKSLGDPPVRIVLWDGQEIGASDARPAARAIIGDRPTLRRLVLDPEFQFGEAYADRRLEIEGDLRAFLELIYRARLQSGAAGHLFRNSNKTRCEYIPALTPGPSPKGRGEVLFTPGPSPKGRGEVLFTPGPSPKGRGEVLLEFLKKIWSWLLHARRANSISASRENIHRHYDLGNDFYRLWLDPQMIYSCAYFAREDMTLAEAQLAKMDYVCRKLWLRPGETVLDVGGGWGGLALHMARHYGVEVKAFNISREQNEFARRRAKDEGLDGRVEFIEDDYRNIAGRFDALVSLGMLEHVGKRHYRDFGRMADRCLAPHGRGLIQTIAQNRPGEANPWIQRRIFPGGHTPTLREMTDIVEPFGFTVLDLENLRLHYAKTLGYWLDRFEASAEEAEKIFDAKFVRTWRLYLSGSWAAFTSGALQLFQFLFARPQLNKIPITRRHQVVFPHPDGWV
jgi:cyclopropane-fatty-acyl-phospholipid synthase